MYRRFLLFAGLQMLVVSCLDEDCHRDVTVQVVDSRSAPVPDARLEFSKDCCWSVNDEIEDDCIVITGSDGSIRLEITGGSLDCALTITSRDGRTGADTFEAPWCDDVTVTVRLSGAPPSSS